MHAIEDDPPGQVAAPLRLRLRLAVDQHAAGGVGDGRCGHELVEIALQTRLERLPGLERLGVDDHEGLPQIGWSLRAEQADDIRAKGRSGQDAGQHVHRQGQPIALVAAGRLLTAQRMQGPGQGGLGRGRRQAVAIDGPADRQELTATRGDLDAAARDRGSRHVQTECAEMAGRRGDGDGIRSRSWARRARVGATSGEVLDSEIPIMPSCAARSAYQPAIP